MSGIDVSIVVPNFQGRALLGACLLSLPSACGGLSYEVIMVDSGSDDGSVAYIASAFPEIRILLLGENKGFGYACNRGAESASGRYIFFLNNDTISGKESITRLVRVGDEIGPSLGALGMRLTDAYGNPAHSWGDFPNPLGQLTKWREKIFRKSRTDGRSQPKVALANGYVVPVDYITGADLLVPRGVFKQMGGFDESFFMYFEDVDLQFRMAKTGLKRFILDEEGIIHLGGGGKGRSAYTRLQTYDSLLLYQYRNLPDSMFCLFRVLYLIFALAQPFNSDFRSKENFQLFRHMVCRALSPIRNH